MTSEAGVEALEIERKYEVAVDAHLPTAERFARAGFSATEPVIFHLAAQYFDTPDEALARAGIAVRVRTGGSDAGWHVKRREPGGVRELHWPVASQMPAGLLDELRARVGEVAEQVAPRATLKTERTVVVLRDAAGAGLVELADDRVYATDLSDGVHRAWREWEAELLPGAAETVLDAVDPLLRAAGAYPSASPAKIARATGKLIALAQARGADPEQLAALTELDAADQAAARRLGS
ncbi:CYTH domain-containing protein [Leucobacter luti]|uniref:CYTH domain-containing protein n=2 Tax=Leucobacter luti TaxID=340320 RepID=UPI0010476989|nr:CYTH domain-containing protein [Leucobacter luti]MCW2288755.1 inorganic triphosphatase YgiF [Leucobacter luti]